MTTYCDYCNSHPEDTYNRIYHDTQYGFPLKDDNLLFERLILEINQAGLSWITILKKAENFRKAYHGFDIQKVSRYGEKDRARLLADPGIIRNRLKVNAAILNAQKVGELQKEYGSFKAWLDANHRLSKEEWVKLFKTPIPLSIMMMGIIALLLSVLGLFASTGLGETFDKRVEIIDGLVVLGIGIRLVMTYIFA
jgi:DNA-3-methyladenine glycosylase I